MSMSKPSVPRTWAEATVPTTEEFRAWLLLLTTDEQIEILNRIMTMERQGVQCWQADHVRELAWLGEQVVQLRKDLTASQQDLRMAAKAFLEVSADRDALREALNECSAEYSQYLQDHP